MIQARDKSRGGFSSISLSDPSSSAHSTLIVLSLLGTGDVGTGIPVSVQGRNSLGWCRDLCGHGILPFQCVGQGSEWCWQLFLSRPDSFHLLVTAQILQLDNLLMAFSARCHLEAQQQLLPVGEGLSLCVITHGQDSSPTNWSCFFFFFLSSTTWMFTGKKSHSWGQNNQDEDFPLQEYKVKAVQNKLKWV